MYLIVCDSITFVCMFFIDDIHRFKEGLETQRYDALLLYVNEDIDFVAEMVKKLETQFKLKVLQISET